MKKQIKSIVLCSLAAVVTAQAWAQGATPSEQLTLVKKLDNSTTFSFNYPTVDNAGNNIVCSAALMAWTPADKQATDSIETIHIYSHATIGEDEGRPSAASTAEITMIEMLPRREYKNTMGVSTADYVGHCIIIAPDYEGYGVTKDRPHPYLAERLTAQQVLDAVRYGMQLYKKQAEDQSAANPVLPIKKNDWRSFGLGYSQGAATTLALQRKIEKEGLAEELHYTGSICGDGPYDLIETMSYYLNDDGYSYDTMTDHRKDFVTYPVVVPLIFNGLCITDAQMGEYKIGDYLSQQLMDTGVLNWIKSKQYHTSVMAKMWYEQLLVGRDTLDRHYTPEQMAEMFTSNTIYKVWGRMSKMLTTATYNYLNDPSKMAHIPTVATNAQEALHKALAENNVAAGWEPKHRIQFYHSKGDMVVPYGNYLAFQKAHQSSEGTMYRINDTYATSDHMDAATLFFSYLSIFCTFTDDFNWICEGQTPTGIETITTNAIQPSQHDNSWYSLDGRRLGGKPTQKGVYIHQNRKIVVR